MLFVLFPLTSAFAATLPANYVDVLRGKPFQVNGSLNYNFTDGNTATGSTMTGAWKYTFPEPVDIAGYSTYGVNGIYGSSTRVDVSHVAGTTTISGNTGNGFTELHIKGVTGITLSRIGTEGGAGTFYDIRMYVDPNANPDASKFVTKGLKAVQSGADAVVLTWDAVDSPYLKEYKVHLNGARYTEVTSNTARINGLSVGVTYTFTVAPIDRGDHLYPGASVSHTIIVPDTTPPDKTTGVSVAPDIFDAVATWDKSKAEDFDVYRVYLDGQAVSGWITTNRFVLTDLKMNTTYQLYVVARDKTGNVSERSSVVKFTTKKLTTDSDQQANDEFILVTWEETPGAVSYNIYLNGSKVGSVGAGTLSFKITKQMGYRPGALENRTEVRAILADGTEGTGGTGGGGQTVADMPFVVGGLIKTGMAWLGLFRNWIILGLSIIFAGILIDFLFYTMKRKRLKQLKGR